MKLVKIIIPIYKTLLTDTEKISLLQTFKVLRKHTIVIVCPIDLEIGHVMELGKDIVFEIERFDKYYFADIESYNDLMLSNKFYKRFLDTKYILICQTDVFVFEDKLKNWCTKDYDYIGAPWLGNQDNFINKILIKLDDLIRTFKNKKARDWSHLFKVGNGGFSLRKVEIFYKISVEYESFIRQERKINNIQEDVFWSLVLPKKYPLFNIPTYQEAVYFAIDRKPKIGVKMIVDFPFACHGFDKPKVRKFWNKYFKKNKLITD